MADETKNVETAQTEQTPKVSETQKAEPAKDAPKETKEPTVKELMAKIEALESREEKAKGSISAANADAAEWKRKYRATLDETERLKQEQADRFTEMEKTLAEYKEKERISTYTAKLIDAGYDGETAKTMATGLSENLPDTFFEAQKAFLASKTQELKTQQLNSQPNLPAGATPTSNDMQSQEDKDLRAMFGL